MGWTDSCLSQSLITRITVFRYLWLQFQLNSSIPQWYQLMIFMSVTVAHRLCHCHHQFNQFSILLLYCQPTTHKYLSSNRIWECRRKKSLDSLFRNAIVILALSSLMKNVTMKKIYGVSFLCHFIPSCYAGRKISTQLVALLYVTFNWLNDTYRD